MIIKEGERIGMNCSGTDTGSSRRRTGSVFGMDAVLCRGFGEAGEKALLIWERNWYILILLEAKTEGSHFTGLEIQAEMAEMASRECGAQQAGREGFDRAGRYQGGSDAV